MNPATAWALAAAHSALFVGSIYVPAKSRKALFASEDRNAPSVIKSRLKATTAATFISLVVTWHVTPLRPQLLFLAPRHVFLTLLLFAAPAYISVIDKHRPRPPSWSIIRDYFVAPLTEELVFRVCIVSTLGAANVSRPKIIFLAPWLFGFAHFHHILSAYLRTDRSLSSLKQPLVQSTAQTLMTAVFGAYVSYIFLRSASLPTVAIIHAFCNYVGPPSLARVRVLYPKHYPRVRFVLYASVAAWLVLFPIMS